MVRDNKEPIRGKVARILNSRELVLNIGHKNGVNEGMVFEVLDPKGEEIYDPDTNELLGSLEKPKIKVKAIIVKEKITVATTYRKKRINVGGYGPDFSDLRLALLPSRWVEEYETLKTNEHTLEDINEEDSYIKTGDPVREDPHTCDEDD